MALEYDPSLIRTLLEDMPKGIACQKHPLSAIIQTTDGQYVLGWNGPPTKGWPNHQCVREGLPSGEGLEICPTVHAEIKAVTHAAKNGINIKGSTIYLSEWFPCADCAKTVVEAGIKRLVTPDNPYFNKTTHTLMDQLRNQSYNFEMAERVLRRADVELVVDLEIRCKP